MSASANNLGHPSERERTARQILDKRDANYRVVDTPDLGALATYLNGPAQKNSMDLMEINSNRRSQDFATQRNPSEFMLKTLTIYGESGVWPR